MNLRFTRSALAPFTAPAVAAMLVTVLPVSADSAADPALAKAIAPFAEDCTLIGQEDPQIYIVNQKRKYDEKETRFEIIQMPCNRAAYNTSEIWFIKDPYGTIQAASFAMPYYDVTYQDNENARVRAITVEGMTSTTEISNSDFDPETLVLTAYHKWRGVGDASSGGSWRFVDGRFVLRTYEVDASWDTKVNPQTLVDYTKK